LVPVINRAEMFENWYLTGVEEDLKTAARGTRRFLVKHVEWKAKRTTPRGKDSTGAGLGLGGGPPVVDDPQVRSITCGHKYRWANGPPAVTQGKVTMIFKWRKEMPTVLAVTRIVVITPVAQRPKAKDVG